MPTKKVAIQTVKAVKEIILLSIDEKFAVRDAQLKYSDAKENFSKAESNLLNLLKGLAAMKNLSVEEYVFNSDNLTFQPK